MASMSEFSRKISELSLNPIIQGIIDPRFNIPVLTSHPFDSAMGLIGATWGTIVSSMMYEAAQPRPGVKEKQKPTPDEYRLTEKAQHNHYDFSRPGQENLEEKIIIDNFKQRLSLSQQYDLLAVGIEHLWNILLPLKKATLEGRVVRPSTPPHHFATGELDWNQLPLPSEVKSFLSANGNLRFNISIQDFTTPKFDRYPEGAVQVGWNEHHMLWLSNPNGEIELHVRKGIFNDGGGQSFYDIAMTEYGFELKFKPVDTDGLLILDDPRNVHVNNNRIPSTALFTAKKILETAFREKSRQQG